MSYETVLDCFSSDSASSILEGCFAYRRAILTNITAAATKNTLNSRCVEATHDTVLTKISGLVMNYAAGIKATFSFSHF